MAVTESVVPVGAGRGVGVQPELRFAWPRLLHIMHPGGRVSLCGVPIARDDVFPAGQGGDHWGEFPSARCPTCESRAKVASC